MPDHAPLLLQYTLAENTGPSSFRYLDVWLMQDEYDGYVRSHWRSYPTVGGMYGLYDKLRRLKNDLRVWNKGIFSNTFSDLMLAEDEAIETTGL